MIRVLIVDDSAFARKVIREVLSIDTEIEVVGIARDGLEALEKIAELKPDVVTLDLVMPDLGGLDVLKILETQHLESKVIVVSVSGSETELAIEALHHGAIDIVQKPTPLPTDRLYELSSELIAKVKSAAIAHPRRVFENSDAEADIAEPLGKKASANLLVIGTSTGGPQAITEIFKRLPTGLPVPIVVALHIPTGYTTAIASRVSQMGFIKMSEAIDGMVLRAGEAVIAPGGRHLTVLRRGDDFVARVSDEPRDLLYHPSIDLLFESAAAAAGPGVLAVVLTGMGNDGTAGARLIKAAGGRVLAESEASCIVYGMPRSVIESGLADSEAVLEKIPELIVQAIFDE